MTRRGVLTMCGVYTVMLAVCIVAGALGPLASQEEELQIALLTCPTLSPPGSPCTLVYSVKAGPFSPLNQVAGWVFYMERPMTWLGTPAALDHHVSWSQAYELDVWRQDEGGTEVPMTQNASHVMTMVCEPGQLVCRPHGLVLLLQLDFKYVRIVLRLDDPTPVWQAADPTVGTNPLTFPARSILERVSVQYTSFTLGWRYFLVTISIAAFAAYSIALRRMRGAKDRNGRALATGLEQRWVWALSLLLVLFNDPLYAASILVPNLGASAVSALSTVTFVTILLLYWMIHLHAATIQTDNAERWQLDPAAMGRLGIVFWAPKIIFATAFWIISLTLYLWTRYNNLTDATYSTWEFVSSFSTFVLVTALITIIAYLLYMFALVVLACRSLAKMRGSHRMFLILTTVTFILILTGLFVGAFTATRITTDAFVVVYGGANLYIYSLMFLYLPTERVTLDDQIDQAAAEAAESDTRGVMAASGLGDLDVDMSDVEAVIHTTTRTATTAGGGGSGPARTKASTPAVTNLTPAAPALPSTFVIEEEDDEGADADGDLGRGAMGTTSASAAAAMQVAIPVAAPAPAATPAPAPAVVVPAPDVAPTPAAEGGGGRGRRGRSGRGANDRRGGGGGDGGTDTP